MELKQWIKRLDVTQLIQRAQTTISHCDLCHQDVELNPLLCSTCIGDLPLLTYQNEQSDLLHWPAIETLYKKRYFDQLVSLAPYQWPFDYWLKQLKYNRQYMLAPGLAQLIQQKLANRLEKITPSNTVILSVPTDIRRWQTRGYNPAHLLAKHVARQTCLRYLPNALNRHKAAVSQVGSSAKLRKKAIRGAFSVSDSAALTEHVILFDDVITTGSTVNEICRLLKKQRVNRITVLTLAIALPNSVTEQTR